MEKVQKSGKFFSSSLMESVRYHVSGSWDDSALGKHLVVSLPKLVLLGVHASFLQWHHPPLFMRYFSADNIMESTSVLLYGIANVGMQNNQLSLL